MFLEMRFDVEQSFLHEASDDTDADERRTESSGGNLGSLPAIIDFYRE